MKLFQGFDLRQWLWAAAVAGAISPVVQAQAPSKPALQAPARLGPQQSARPIQQVAGTTNPQRNNPMRPAAPVQISADPNAPKSDIQRQLGHVSISTTQVYRQLTEAASDSEVESDDVDAAELELISRRTG